MNSRRTSTALITGASSGIGAAFAHALASRGHDLVLVARREDRLTRLADDLQHRFLIRAEVLAADLCSNAGVERVEKRIMAFDALGVLVSNAGFGVPGPFAGVPWEKSLAMIQLHVLAGMRLGRAALPGMIDRRRGDIILVSSIGAFIPRPGDAAYCATKAFLNTFAQALHGELQGTGVSVQALCPGFVTTEFLDRPEYEQLQIKDKIPKWLWMPAEVVVEESLRSLWRDQVVCIPGLKNRILVALARGGLAGVLLNRLANSLREQSLIPAPRRSPKPKDPQ